jgi:hypothetical protein
MTQPCNEDLSDLPVESWEEDSASVTPDQIKVLVVDDSSMSAAC